MVCWACEYGFAPVKNKKRRAVMMESLELLIEALVRLIIFLLKVSVACYIIESKLGLWWKVAILLFLV